MSITAPVIFASFAVADASTGSNSTTYTAHAVEGREITVEEETVEIDDGQTLTNSYLVSFRVTTYDSDVRNDTHIQFNGASGIDAARITFTGAAGAATMQIDGIRLNGVDAPAANGRRGYTIHGTKRVTTNPITYS